MCRGIFWHFRILERFEIKGWQDDECLSMYIITTIPHGKCLERYLRTCCFLSEISLVCCAHSFNFWYVNNSCVNTIRPHFPWSVLCVLHCYQSCVYSDETTWCPQWKIRHENLWKHDFRDSKFQNVPRCLGPNKLVPLVQVPKPPIIHHQPAT